MHLTWAKCSSVIQSYCSSPLALCAMTILQWITRKAFSTVIAFSSPQAWPQGWLEPPSRGTRSLRALRWLGEQGCSPRSTQCLLALLGATVSNSSCQSCQSHVHVHPKPVQSKIKRHEVKRNGMNHSVLLLASCLVSGSGAFPPCGVCG